MALLQVISDHIAISLVLLVVFIALTVFLAQRISGSKGSPDDSQLDQSPAAKAFRKKLQDISLDLDKD
ncbi:MAG: hypothetical protein Q4G44_05400 [Alcaligenaceae bacterium]|nr:hypothetical protein [Alcaligenaceae bacterium]